ncbi:MAG TPA: UDP-3-O-(3-hydroxymyristoyl)glucosamine N-acyltransferase [Opitutaceae bacterium]|jgi:UDP-3-O-[3-hydroxymyristoyl] glucosamine N-acyltransferase|nr:UDP-3-O-(3-hydroxymyristoyl)glucosamine N-acyltransferase [Opitutaceae bacterium]
MQIAFTVAELVALLQPRATRGATTETIRGIAALTAAQPGDLSFLGNPKYKKEVAASVASVVLLPVDYAGEPRANQLFFLVENPSVALARLCARLEQQLWPRPAPGVHVTAQVDPGARVAATATVGPLCIVEAGAVIGERTHLQAQVFIGRGASIGDDCWLMPGVMVATECRLGRRVRLHAGAVIGSDGFGYEFVAGRHEKVPQVGQVVVEDDVEIGANTTIDRARFSRTLIGEGTKIDNLVQIAHNVVIGKHCLICAQAGVSGSTVVGDYVVLGGQAGLAGHITVGRGSKIDGQTGVNSDLEPGSSAKGTPWLPYQLEQRINVLRPRLPELFRRVDALEEQIKKSSAAT